MTKTVNDATNRLFAGAPVSALPGTEPKEQTAEERWNSAGIGNAFIFGKVMSANPYLLLELLQISLPEMEIGRPPGYYSPRCEWTGLQCRDAAAG